MVYLVQGYYLLLKFQLDYSYVFDQLEFLTRCFGVKVPNARHNTDSKYVKDGITKWITTWKTNN
jgi:ribonuclease HI